MKYILKGAKVFLDEEFKFRDIMIENGKIKAICRDIRAEGGEVVFDFKNKYIFPGLVDVHVHLREPGFLYKETIATASAAAVSYTHLDVYKRQFSYFASACVFESGIFRDDYVQCCL